MATRQTYYALAGLTALTGGIGFFSYYQYSKRNLAADFKLLMNKISDKSGNRGGDFTDLSNKGNALDPDLYKRNPARVTVSPTVAAKLAMNMYEAKGSIYNAYNDNEAAIGTAFKQMKNKEDASRVADAFKGKYRQDLYYFLSDFLSDSEMEEYVNKYINQLK